MKQVFFDGKGKLMIQDVPVPPVPPNGALVRVHYSLISTGTEMTQATGGGSLIRKAIQQPELVVRAERFRTGACHDFEPAALFEQGR